MTDRSFVDTNILVYGVDTDLPHKRDIALSLIADLIRRNHLVLSSQVLAEFVSALTKPRFRLSREQIRKCLGPYQLSPLVAIDHVLVLRALDAQTRYQLSWWDSLIVAAAERGSCKVIYSEDLNHGQSYFGIAVCNPFSHAVMDAE